MTAHRRFRRIGVTGLLLTAVVFALAGCGDKEPSKSVASVPTTANSGASVAASGSANPVAYAQCMRANGLPDFPDPDAGGNIRLGGGGQAGAMDPNSQTFKQAQEKCKQYQSTQGGNGNAPQTAPWSLDQKLAYSKCMRGHGLPDFPDPDKEGQFPALPKGGANGPGSPTFTAADKACAQYKPQGDAGGAPGGGQ
jgi:hypothetical protein